MNWRKTLSAKKLVYLILDENTAAKNNINLLKTARELAKAGQIDIFQLRMQGKSDKSTLELAQKLAAILHKYRKIFIVNNRADIAYLAGADGVHLGAEDIPVYMARKLLPHKLIGKTVHSLKELLSFQKEDVNYLSLGPVFKTNTKKNIKPMGVKKLKNMIKYVKLPFFVIGGINAGNIGKLKTTGVANLALCEGVLSAANTVQAAAEIKAALNKVLAF